MVRGHEDLPEVFHNLKFTKKDVPILGIYIGQDRKCCDDKNLSDKINRNINKYREFKKINHHLQYINIVKTFAISQPIYVCTILETPECAILAKQSISFEYVIQCNVLCKKQSELSFPIFILTLYVF